MLNEKHVSRRSIEIVGALFMQRDVTRHAHPRAYRERLPCWSSLSFSRDMTGHYYHGNGTHGCAVTLSHLRSSSAASKAISSGPLGNDLGSMTRRDRFRVRHLVERFPYGATTYGNLVTRLIRVIFTSLVPRSKIPLDAVSVRYEACRRMERSMVSGGQFLGSGYISLVWTVGRYHLRVVTEALLFLFCET